MGRAILCIGDTAKTPYLLEKPGISIYTVEELCYCIRENTILMDERVVCGELADWLCEECGLGQLADSLRALLKAKASASTFLTAILEYTGFYPWEEIRRIERFLNDCAGLSGLERQKNVADYLAQNGRYAQAMQQYEEALAAAPDTDTLMRAKLFHNMGYVCSQLFQFGRAAEFFHRAYELSGDRESALQFLAAERMRLDEKQYVNFIMEQPEKYYQLSMELEKRVEQTAAQWQEYRQAEDMESVRSEEENPEDRLEALLDAAQRMKTAYRDMTGEKQQSRMEAAGRTDAAE